jgi:hypothetical protein
VPTRDKISVNETGRIRSAPRGQIIVDNSGERVPLLAGAYRQQEQLNPSGPGGGPRGYALVAAGAICDDDVGRAVGASLISTSSTDRLLLIGPSRLGCFDTIVGRTQEGLGFPVTVRHFWLPGNEPT